MAEANVTSNSSIDFGKWLSTAALPVALALLVIFFSFKAPVFFSLNNWISISVQVASLMTVSVPFAILLMTGKVDLSVGSVAGLSGVIAGLIFPELDVVPTVLVVLAIGFGIGVMNGFLVGYLSMSPIIVTLGTLTAARGLAQWLSPAPLFDFPESFTFLGYGKLAGVPILTIIMLAVLMIGLFVMARTPLGRHAIAIGVNERASYLVGIRVKLTIMLLYGAVGFGAALGGLMTVARINSAPSGTLGVGMELSVLTAVLLGGVPFTGGRGSLLRVALGVWLLGMLSNGLILMNVPTETSLMITGLVLFLAAGLNVLKVQRG
ncbi:ABC transporter permease [Methylorubrum populi]|uniref:ABC transporter permease n=1 Tax=Methylorubrum TaxID=2282523 RepID=UPI00114F7CB6|nr:ABC transporter permease [Methylorubrum populi]QDI79915.1 ABC transporter permease [Methylorubrum populi]